MVAGLLNLYAFLAYVDFVEPFLTTEFPMAKKGCRVVGYRDPFGHKVLGLCKIKGKRSRVKMCAFLCSIC